MTDKIEATAASSTRPKTVIERTYRAQRGNHEAVDRGLHLPAYEAGQALQLEAVAPRV
jgi:hypothetical protein